MNLAQEPRVRISPLSLRLSEYLSQQEEKKVRWQKCEAAGHRESTVREHRAMDAGHRVSTVREHRAMDACTPLVWGFISLLILCFVLLSPRLHSVLPVS